MRCSFSLTVLAGLQFASLGLAQLDAQYQTASHFSSGSCCPLLRLLLPRRTFTTDAAGYEQTVNTYWYVRIG